VLSRLCSFSLGPSHVCCALSQPFDPARLKKACRIPPLRRRAGCCGQTGVGSWHHAQQPLIISDGPTYRWCRAKRSCPGAGRLVKAIARWRSDLRPQFSSYAAWRAAGPPTVRTCRRRRLYQAESSRASARHFAGAPSNSVEVREFLGYHYFNLINWKLHNVLFLLVS